MSLEVRKLHLGCFDQIIPGWVNTDITSHIWLSKIPGAVEFLHAIKLLPQNRYEQHRQGIFKNITYLNVVKKFPYPDSYFDYVFSSHLLEHLYLEDAYFCISEVYRVLKPGGLVRTAVPDLDKIVAAYDPNNPTEFLEGIFESKQKRDKNRHHWHYNYNSLTKLLKTTGFKETNRCEYQQGRCIDVKIIDNRPHSLFMEAIK